MDFFFSQKHIPHLVQLSHPIWLPKVNIDLLKIEKKVSEIDTCTTGLFGLKSSKNVPLQRKETFVKIRIQFQDDCQIRTFRTNTVH